MAAPSVPTSASFLHELLWCRLRAISFPDPQTCRLDVDRGNCTDMTGAIQVAQDATKHLCGFDLRTVWVVAEEEADAFYTRDEEGRWSFHEGRR